MTNPLYETTFAVGEPVFIDREISGVVVEISINHGPIFKYRVEWFHNGILQTAWLDLFRLS